MFTDQDLKREFDHVAVARRIEAGAELMRPGDRITHVPIVTKGALRILLQNPGHYRPMFVVAGLSYLVCLLIVHLLVPRFEPAEIP